jgi:hypothetical protein
MLRVTKPWRRLFGLKGSIFYYDDKVDAGVKWSTTHSSAAIAALSTVLTAIFAYQNLSLTQANFAVAHPPKLEAISLGARHSGDDVTFSFFVKNNSDSLAKDAWVALAIHPHEEPPYHSDEIASFFSKSESVSPKDMKFLETTWKKATPTLSANKTVRIEATLFYLNLHGDSQDPIYACYEFDGKSVEAADCSDVALKKWFKQLEAKAKLTPDKARPNQKSRDKRIPSK